MAKARVDKKHKQLRSLTVSEETHRGIFASVGVALLVGGLGLVATSAGIAATAAPGRSLTPTLILTILGVVTVFGGFLVFAGSLTTTKYLPLPGKRAIVEHRALQADAKAHAEWAKWVLVQAISQGRLLNLDPDVNQIDAILWGNNSLNFVMEAWGLTEAQPINTATPPAHLVPGVSIHEAWIGPTLNPLLQLLSSCHEKQLAPSGLAMTKHDYDVWHLRFGGLITGDNGLTKTPTEVANQPLSVPDIAQSPTGEVK